MNETGSEAALHSLRDRRLRAVLAKYRTGTRTGKNSRQGVEGGARIGIIYQNWCREMAGAKCRHGNGTFLACAARTRRITHLKGKIVAAWPNLEIVLENHTLVGTVDLLERWNPDDFLLFTAATCVVPV